MTDDSTRRRLMLDAQIERWTNDAKKLIAAGKEPAALDLYQRAADELPGAPWLQHRTAELARKLGQDELAIAYFRRAATAFQLADFSKRALAPLRTAWTLAVQGLPASSKVLLEVAVDLIVLHRRLGFVADASVALERTNDALRAHGFSELPAQLLEAAPPRSQRPSAPPRSAQPSQAPPSEVAPRASGSAKPSDAAPSSRSRALAHLLGRR